MALSLYLKFRTMGLQIQIYWNIQSKVCSQTKKCVYNLGILRPFTECYVCLIEKWIKLCGPCPSD